MFQVTSYKTNEIYQNDKVMSDAKHSSGRDIAKRDCDECCETFFGKRLLFNQTAVPMARSNDAKEEKGSSQLLVSRRESNLNLYNAHIFATSIQVIKVGLLECNTPVRVTIFSLAPLKSGSLVYTEEINRLLR
mmetsp:Transcript_7488/g.18440  ORF Transcript_7488/g.18440 Transcript_7488/m.18440 type:complete len:133 (+) Transcript_7488:3244-3642(+)